MYPCMNLSITSVINTVGSVSPMNISRPMAKFSLYIIVGSCMIDSIISSVSKTGTLAKDLLRIATFPFVSFNDVHLNTYSVLAKQVNHFVNCDDSTKFVQLTRIAKKWMWRTTLIV